MSNTSNFSYSPRYRPAQVKKGKELIVEFYCKNPFTENLQRYRIRLNHLKMKHADKVIYAENVVMDINNKLQSGWNPEIDDLNTSFRYKLMSDAFKEYINLKKTEDLRPDTIRSYQSFLDNFSRFVTQKFGEKIFIGQINKKIVGEFAHYLTNKRKISPRTFNNYMNGLSTIFQYFVDHGYKTVNPFATIHLKKTPTKRRMFINDQERKKILEYFLKNDRNFCRIMLMSYFTLLRRKEITLLKVRDIDLKKKIVFVSAEISKNRIDGQVTLAPNIIEFLKELNIENCNPDYYLFSENFVPGSSKLNPKKISDVWAKMRDQLELSNRLQFMSLRDSGIKNLIKLNIPLDDVMNHARHHSLEVTKTYLIHATDQAIDSIKNSQIEF